MTIQQNYGIKPRVAKEFTGTGILINDLPTTMCQSLRVVFENVGAGNVVVIRGRLTSQTAYTTLLTATGSVAQTVDISLVDYVQIECTTYQASGGTPKIIASAFATSSGGGGGGGGDASAANQVIGNASLASIDGKTPALVAGKVPVDTGLTQPLTDAQLRASVVPVAPNVTRGSGIADANTQRVTLASDGPAVTALTSIDAKTPALVSGNQPVLMRIEKKDGSLVEARGTETDSMSVGNFLQKFRDGFVVAQPDLSVWDQAWVNQGTGFVNAGGNSSGSAYLRISMCPLRAGSEYTLATKQTFNFPYRHGFGISASQRILGQEIEASAVGVSGANVIETITPIADLSISGTVTIATNVATINFAAAHGLTGGDRVILVGNAEPRLNVGPVVVTVVTATQITVPCTLANGTYTAGGVVRYADPIAYAKNAAGMLYENTTATNASFVARRNGARFRTTNSTVSTTTATQSNTSPYTDAFNSAGDMELVADMEEVFYAARPADALTAPTGGTRYSQGIPDEENPYKVRFRVKNLDNLTVPVARIVSIAKTGTTTATVTTDVAHGLTATDQIQIYGVRDQTNFPNLTAQTVVSSIISTTQFTVVIGTASTTSSAGGVVWKVQGSTLAPGVVTMAAQSISRTNNILTIVGSATWAGLLPGEYVHLYGCDATSMGLYDGPYKVLRTSTTTLEVESVGADFTSINCGGAVIKRTDVRIHYVRMADYTRHAVEMMGARGNIDAARAQPITGAVTVSSGTVTTVTTVTTCSTLTGGAAAEDAATTSNPLIVGGVVRTAAAPTTLIAGDAARLTMSSAAQVVTKEFSVADTDFQVPAPVGGIANTTTSFQVAPAAGALLRNYITQMDFYSEALTTATDLRIREPDLTCSSQTIASNTLTVSATHNLAVGDSVIFTASTVTGISTGVTYYVLTVPSGTTLTLSATRGGSTLAISGTGVTATFHKVLWMTRIPTTGMAPREIQFATPLRGSVNTILQLQTATASGAGAVYASFQGFTAQ